MVEPITKKEKYLAKISGDYSGTVPKPVTHLDYYMAFVAGAYDGLLPTPIQREERYWAYICGATDISLPEPVTRIERYLGAICGGMILLPAPITREEIYLAKIAKQSESVVKFAEGKMITLTDSLDAPFEDFHIYGHSAQRTTTGINIFNPHDRLDADFMPGEGSLTGSGWATVIFDNAWVLKNLKPNTTYYASTIITMNEVAEGEYSSQKNKALYLWRNDESVAGGFELYFVNCMDALQNEESVKATGTLTTPDDLTDLMVLAYTERYVENENGSGTAHFSNVTFSEIMLSESNAPYETYTGGKPSPNPDYPQEIVSVGTKWTTRANLIDISKGNLKGWNLYDISNNLEVGKSYVFSNVNVPVGTRLLGLDADGNELCLTKSYAAAGTSEVFVMSEGIETLMIDGDGTWNPIDARIMLNEGTEPLPWEPYTGGNPGVVGDKIEVSVGGKNLLDVGTVTFEHIKEISADIPAGTYTVSAEVESNDTDTDRNLVLFMHGTEEMTSTFLSRGQRSNSVAVLPDSSDRIILYASDMYNSSIGDIATFKNFILERGDIATAYEPYKQPQTLTVQTPNSLPGIPVSSGGNYTDENGQQWFCDEIDFGRGKHVQRINTLTLDGDTLKITANATNEFWNLPYNSAINPSQSVAVWSNYFRPGKFSTNEAYNFLWTTPAKMTGLFETADELSDFVKQKYDEGSPVILMYVMRESIETALSDEELAAYQSLHTNTPTTVISNDADAWMKVGYMAKPVSQYNEIMTLEYLKGE